MNLCFKGLLKFSSPFCIVKSRRIVKMKTIIKIILILLSGILVIVLLWFLFVRPRMLNRGFDRTYFTSVVTKVTSVVPSSKKSEITGMSQNRIYLSTEDPHEILITDSLLSNVGSISVQLDKEFVDRSSHFFITRVDSPDFRIFSGNRPSVAFGKLSGTSVKVDTFNPGSITRVISLANNSYVLRKLDFSKKDQVFFKYYPDSGYLKPESNISDIRHDAGMVTDGFLDFDRKTSLIAYVYCYKNVYQLIDTNLNLIRVGNTIDTFTQYQMQVEKAVSGKKTTISQKGPAFIVNRISTFYDSLLYISSNAISNDESYETLDKHEIIDVYNLVKGKYVGSFLLPLNNHKRSTRIHVYRSMLYCNYENEWIIYKLDKDKMCREAATM